MYPIKMVNVAKLRASIEHLLAESRDKFVPEYLGDISERIFTIDGRATHIDAALLNSITKEEAVNVVASVYDEICNNRDVDRIWKVRDKRQYPTRRPYSFEAFVLKWLEQRCAPVPALVVLIEDIMKKEELRKELGPFVPTKEKLEAIIEKANEKEAIVMRKLKEPRHDQDLAYLVGKIHDTGIDKTQRERYNKHLLRVSSMALESIMTISIVANHYYNTDFQKAGIKLFDPLENNPGYYANEISKNITRVIISNLIEQGLMRDKEDEINSYKLPPEFEQRVKHVFAPVLEHLANPQFRG
ncbi:hypothetical protein KY342_03705, partial [Candidatus Woesearchaeota archaeon]|nr:hypothetical protein [Candidatus Woesearchaeota archaeon]